MNKRLFKYEVIGFVFVSIVGTISHFVYDFTNQNEYVALFCPVNESPWEHLKMLFFPFIFYSVFEKTFALKKADNFWVAKLVGIILGMTSVLSFFYLYSGILGKIITAFDISSFFIGVFVSFLVSYLIINSGKFSSKISQVISICLILATSFVFFVFTYMPPYIPLFKDMTTGIYGI